MNVLEHAMMGTRVALSLGSAAAAAVTVAAAPILTARSLTAAGAHDSHPAAI